MEPDGDLAGNGEAEEADETPEVASSVEKSESAQEIEEDPQAPEIVPAEAVPDEQDDVQDEGISEGAGGFALPRLQLPRFLRRQTQTDEGVSSLTGDVSDSPDEALPDLEEEEIDGEEVSTLLIAPPEPPQLGLREHSGDSGYVLHWEGVPEAAYYVLQESTRMAFSDGRQATVKSNEWHVNQRPPGTYYYRVRAHTEDDHTEWSNIVYKQIQAGKA